MHLACIWKIRVIFQFNSRLLMFLSQTRQLLIAHTFMHTYIHTQVMPMEPVGANTFIYIYNTYNLYWCLLKILKFFNFFESKKQLKVVHIHIHMYNICKSMYVCSLFCFKAGFLHRHIHRCLAVCVLTAASF